MEQTLSYDAFISYSHTQVKEAVKIQKVLERIGRRWPFFGKGKLRIFRDETDMSAASSLPDSIKDALASSRLLVIFASPGAVHSKWVNEEILWWVVNKSPNDILIVVLEGAINWEGNDFNWKNTNCLPNSLKKVFSAEPLYVDLRSTGGLRSSKHFFNRTNKQSGIIRLAARLLHKRPRDLALSETTRLIRTISILGVVVLAIFILSFKLFQSSRQIDLTKQEGEQKVAQARKEAKERQMTIDQQLINDYITDGNAYFLAKESALALVSYTKARELAAKPWFDTLVKVQQIRSQLKEKIRLCDAVQ